MITISNYIRAFSGKELYISRCFPLMKPHLLKPKPKKETYSTEELLGSTNTGWFVAPQYLGSREAFPVVAIPKRKPRRPSVVINVSTFTAL